MDGDTEDVDFGRGGVGRDDVDLAREMNPRDLGLLLHDSVISDEEFVLLYDEIYLSALKLEREGSLLL